LYDAAVAAHAAYLQARTLASSAIDPAVRAQLDSIAPAPARPGGRRGFGRRGGADVAQTLNSASDALIAAAMVMQSADVAPTASQLAGAEKAQRDAQAVMARWAAVKSRVR
jgi:hypothetical protein